MALHTPRTKAWQSQNAGVVGGGIKDGCAMLQPVHTTNAHQINIFLHIVVLRSTFSASDITILMSCGAGYVVVTTTIRTHGKTRRMGHVMNLDIQMIIPKTYTHITRSKPTARPLTCMWLWPHQHFENLNVGKGRWVNGGMDVGAKCCARWWVLKFVHLNWSANRHWSWQKQCPMRWMTNEVCTTEIRLQL